MSLHDIEHLTADGTGYVYWKGREVEHYNHPFNEANAPKLRKLAERCQYVESLGLTPNSSLVVWRWDWVKCLAPNHPYLGLIAHGFYEIVRKGNAILFSFRYRDGEVEAVMTAGSKVAFHPADDWGYNESYQRRRREGWTTFDLGQDEHLGQIYAPFHNLMLLFEEYQVPTNLHEMADQAKEMFFSKPLRQTIGGTMGDLAVFRASRPASPAGEQMREHLGLPQ